MFKPVPNRVDYVNLEHEVQALWDANDIPRKYRERNQDADRALVVPRRADHGQQPDGRAPRLGPHLQGPLQRF